VRRKEEAEDGEDDDDDGGGGDDDEEEEEEGGPKSMQRAFARRSSFRPLWNVSVYINYLCRDLASEPVKMPVGTCMLVPSILTSPISLERVHVTVNSTIGNEIRRAVRTGAAGNRTGC
jgi:hypothetical protein